MSEALLDLDTEGAPRTGGDDALRSGRIGAGVVARAAREYFDRKLRMRVREVSDVRGVFPAIVDRCKSHINFAVSRQLIRIYEAGGHLPLRIAFQRSTYSAG